VSRIWLRHWAEQRLRGAPSADLYLERPQRLLLAAATGVAVTVYVAGALIGSVGDVSLAVVARRLAVFALIVLVVGQLIPRAVARRWPTALLPVLLPLLRGVEIVLAPFVVVARRVTTILTPRVPVPVDSKRDDLEDLLREGELEGVGERQEMEIITGVMEFGEKTVGDVMIPREEIFAIGRDAGAREIAEEVATSAFSRVPVFEGSLDHVIGMIHAFDVLKLGGERVPALRPVAMAPASTPCSDLLFRMLRKRTHLAIVHDIEGHTIGLVTLEDLLEELVGDIRDEHDEPAQSPTT